MLNTHYSLPNTQPMFLQIITPDKKVFEGEVESATFPGTKGSFQVLTNHALGVDGGVVEVLNNKISVLVERLLSE